jgi:hypothetical protein
METSTIARARPNEDGHNVLAIEGCRLEFDEIVRHSAIYRNRPSLSAVPATFREKNLPKVPEKRVHALA